MSIGNLMKKSTIGDRIKEIRTSKNISSAKLAELLEISQPTVSWYETGKSEPTAQTLKLLVEKLQVDPAWLLTGTTSQKTINNNTALRIGAVADKLPEEIRQSYLAAMERELMLHTMLEKQREAIQKASSE